MIRIGESIQFDGHTYVITTNPSPIEDMCVDGEWYPSAFTASAYCTDEVPDADGWRHDYSVFYELRDGVECTAPHETLCDWLHPDDVDWSGSLYNVAQDDWKWCEVSDER